MSLKLEKAACSPLVLTSLRKPIIGITVLLMTRIKLQIYSINFRTSVIVLKRTLELGFIVGDCTAQTSHTIADRCNQRYTRNTSYRCHHRLLCATCVSQDKYPSHIFHPGFYGQYHYFLVRDLVVYQWLSLIHI